MPSINGNVRRLTSTPTHGGISNKIPHAVGVGKLLPIGASVNTASHQLPRGTRKSYFVVPRIQPSLEGEEKAKGVAAAALCAPTAPNSTGWRGKHLIFSPGEAGAPCAGAEADASLLPLGHGARSSCPKVSCWVLPEGTGRSPGVLGFSCLAGAPSLRTWPGLPATAAVPAGEPGPSQPHPAEPAPALSGTLRQMWGGLSRAIGLGHCLELTSRITPGVAVPWWAEGRVQASASLFTSPTPPPSPSGSPSFHPWSPGFETVVTPQTKRAQRGGQMGAFGVSQRFWLFALGEQALWGQK